MTSLFFCGNILDITILDYIMEYHLFSDIQQTVRGYESMKMIVAILQKNDELQTIDELNTAGYFVTKLATSGGFLKGKNTTIMTVVEDEKVPEVLEIIRANSGERKTITYANPALVSGQGSLGAAPTVPINIQVGGSTVFVLNVEQMEKF